MKKSNNFVHLHVHTHYDILNSTIRFSKYFNNPLFDKIIEFGMTAIAITDYGTMHGIIDFYTTALKNNVKPIIGCEFSVEEINCSNNKNTYHLVFLAKDIEGYQNLCRLSSMVNSKGLKDSQNITQKDLKEYSNGLIALSGCIQGEIPSLIIKNKIEDAENTAQYYNQKFGEGNFYLEVQASGRQLQNTVNQHLFEIGHKFSIPLVATNDCHYLNHEEANAYKALTGINQGKKINESSTGVFANS